MPKEGFSRNFATSLILLAGFAQAQEQRGISIGQLRLLPTVGLTFGNDDNVAFASEERVESSFFVVSPGIRLEAPTDKSILTVGWEGEFGRYDDSPIDDYDTWTLSARWNYDPTSRTRLGLFAEFAENRDRRGEGRTQGGLGPDQLEPDEYEMLSFGGHWSHGAVGARGRLELEARHDEREYQNNREFTLFLDNQTDHLGGTFYLRIRPKTSLLVDVAWADITYDFTDPGAASLDSRETRLYVGVEWDATARTSGRIQYGILEKKFDDPARESYDDDSWLASVTWRPRTYSVFTLTASRETDESYGFGDYVLRDDVSLSWNHYWSTRFSTIVEYGLGTDEHRPDVRTDDYTYWGVAARYQFTQWLQLGAGYHGYERDSDDPLFDYDRRTWMITAEASY